MITRFRVQNYKALRDVTLDLTPVHVLIGPNDSGKTSILEAIAALCRSVDHSLQAAFLGDWSGNQLVTNREDRPVLLSATLNGWAFADIKYACRFKFSNETPQCSLESETVSLSTGRIFNLPKREMDSKSNIHLASLDSSSMVGMVFPGTLSPGNEEHEDRIGEGIVSIQQIQKALSSVHFHRWDPRFLSLPVAPDSRRRFRMDHNGFGLALCLDDILGSDRASFGKLEDAFRKVFPRVKSIRLIAVPAYRAAFDNPVQITVLQNAEGKGIYFEFEGQPALVPASQVSDGLLIVLAYLALLHLPEPPRVLLIEEPENGIHPGRLQEIIRIIKQLVSEQSHTQVVMTTHSPYVLHEFSPAEVTVCVRETNGEVKTRRLSESKSVQEQIGFFSLGEIWTMDGDERLLQPVDDSVEAAKVPEVQTSP